MQKKNEYGELIVYERIRSCVSAEQLCEGLCSAENLRKIEKGERSCEKILADALFQRLGISSDRFSYLLKEEEYKDMMIREKIVFLVDQNQKEEAKQYLEKYQIQTKGRHILFLQFCKLANLVLEWKNGKAIETMQQDILGAWNLTKKGKKIRIREGQYFSSFEIVLVMLYMYLLEKSGKEADAEEGYQELLNYMENKISIQDRVKWYPQLSYRQMRILRKKGNIEKALEIGAKTLKLLRNQASLNYLVEILEEYSKLLKESYVLKEEKIPPEMEKQLEEIDFIREKIKWLYKEYRIESTKWVWNIFFGMSEIYLCKDVIRGRRLGIGMTQEELADGICDPVTISRIERGKSFPKRNVLLQLLQKLKWSGENCTLTAQIGRPEYHSITSQISMLTHTGKMVEAEKLLDELEQKVQKKNIFAKQYFLSMNVVKHSLGNMDAKTLVKLQKQAFYLTVPEEITYEKLKQWHFSRMEVMCANKMSYFCEKEKEKDVLELLYLVKKFYERQPFQLRYYRAGYELTMRNIGNLLGNMGKYEEAIKAADDCIKLALNLQKGGNISSALYDKGWDMEKLWEKKFYTKEESLAYIEASYALNLFLGKEEQCKFIRNHVKEFYHKKIYSSDVSLGKSE